MLGTTKGNGIPLQTASCSYGDIAHCIGNHGVFGKGGTIILPLSELITDFTQSTRHGICQNVVGKRMIAYNSLGCIGGNITGCRIFDCKSNGIHIVKVGINVNRCFRSFGDMIILVQGSNFVCSCCCAVIPAGEELIIRNNQVLFPREHYTLIGINGVGHRVCNTLLECRILIVQGIGIDFKVCNEGNDIRGCQGNVIFGELSDIIDRSNCRSCHSAISACRIYRPTLKGITLTFCRGQNVVRFNYGKGIFDHLALCRHEAGNGITICILILEDIFFQGKVCSYFNDLRGFLGKGCCGNHRNIIAVCILPALELITRTTDFGFGCQGIIRLGYIKGCFGHITV